MKNLKTLDMYQLQSINGGTFWGAEVVAGVAGVVTGVAMLGVPEPTGITKATGYSGVVLGSAGAASGVRNFLDNI